MAGLSMPMRSGGRVQPATSNATSISVMDSGDLAEPKIFILKPAPERF
jgi:hypothetical protein